jgi:hypothetical protein
MRCRVYRRTVTRMRAGEPGQWSQPVGYAEYDRQLVKRLMSRVAYGGRKGRAAFLRLWRMSIRPSAIRLGVKIKGFELMSEQDFQRVFTSVLRREAPVFEALAAHDERQE